ncbi:putative peptidoglycan-N-acetylglucosamine deacetylase [Microsporum ferrugineum]
MLFRLYTLVVAVALVCCVAAIPLQGEQASSISERSPNGWPWRRPHWPRPRPHWPKPHWPKPHWPKPQWPKPTEAPTMTPVPTAVPSSEPPVTTPTAVPTAVPTDVPTTFPTMTPTADPTVAPTGTSAPTSVPTTVPPGPGNIPYGQVISNCVVNGTIAISFDDGPFDYTAPLLDLLDQYGAKGTFFVNAMNFGNIKDYADVIKRMYTSGHHLGSHTYSHADLGKLSAAKEMNMLDSILATIIDGNRPTYMRAPYFSYSDIALKTLGELQYHVIDASIDTKDYEHATPDGVPISLQNFKQGLNAGGSITLCHDVHQTTVELLVKQILDEVKARGLRAVTVGECLGDPQANWYRPL